MPFANMFTALAVATAHFSGDPALHVSPLAVSPARVTPIPTVVPHNLRHGNHAQQWIRATINEVRMTNNPPAAAITPNNAMAIDQELDGIRTTMTNDADHAACTGLAMAYRNSVTSLDDTTYTYAHLSLREFEGQPQLMAHAIYTHQGDANLPKLLQPAFDKAKQQLVDGQKTVVRLDAPIDPRHCQIRRPIDGLPDDRHSYTPR